MCGLTIAPADAEREREKDHQGFRFFLTLSSQKKKKNKRTMKLRPVICLLKNGLCRAVAVVESERESEK